MRYQQTKLCWGPRGLRPAERLPAACKPPDNGGRSGPGRSAEPRGSPAHRHAGQRRTGEHRPPRSHGALRFREGTINPHPLPSARHRSPESPRSAAGPPSPREAPQCPALLPRPDPHRASASQRHAPGRDPRATPTRIESRTKAAEEPTPPRGAQQPPAASPGAGLGGLGLGALEHGARARAARRSFLAAWGAGSTRPAPRLVTAAVHQGEQPIEGVPPRSGSRLPRGPRSGRED